MDIEKSVSLASQYGIATVLCFVMVGILVWVLVTVFRENARRETALAGIINSGLVNITSSLSNLSQSIQSNTMMVQEIARNMKDGFDNQKKADDYHRSDLKIISEELHQLKKSVDDNVCQFYEKKK